MHPAISVNNLTKKYKEKSVVDALSFDIEKGSIMGCLDQTAPVKQRL